MVHSEPLCEEWPPEAFNADFLCEFGVAIATLGTKKHGNGNVQANVRANNSGRFEGTPHENVGFRGKKGQKVHCRAPKGSYARKGVFLPSRCLLESPFLEPLLRILLRTLSPMKPTARHLLRTLFNFLENNLENPSKNATIGDKMHLGTLSLPLFGAWHQLPIFKIEL